MTQPPRAVDSLLKALGADPYLVEVILGDMAEEFAERAHFDGVLEARRWYAREALRATPHLLRSAVDQLRFVDVPRLIGVALFAWVSLLPIGLTLYITVSLVLRLLGIESLLVPTTPNSVAFTVYAMIALPLGGLVGGYVAAWRHKQAPLLGAMAYGIVCTSANLLTGLFFPSPMSAGFRTAALLAFNASALLGALIRAERAGRSAEIVPAPVANDAL